MNQILSLLCSKPCNCSHLTHSQPQGLHGAWPCFFLDFICFFCPLLSVRSSHSDLFFEQVISLSKGLCSPMTLAQNVLPPLPSEIHKAVLHIRIKIFFKCHLNRLFYRLWLLLVLLQNLLSI